MRLYNVACAMGELGLSRRKGQQTGFQSASIALPLVLALLGLAGVAPASAQPTTTLRFSLPISPDGPTGQNIREFARQIQARTMPGMT